jgi:hypothetical protein
MRKGWLLICVFGLPCLSWSQTSRAAWSNLSALRVGQKIQIVEMNSKKHSGTFANVSDTVISYQEATGERTIQKQNIRSVKLMENKHRLRNALIWGAVGTGAGAGIGAATYHANSCPANAVLCLNGIGGRGVPTAAGAAIGLVGGVIIGALLPSHKMIYSVNSH